jgi:hypothetical protein
MTARRKARHGDNTFDARRLAMLLGRWAARGFAGLLLAAAGFAAPAAAQSSYDVFTIAPVRVDVTAANASQARDQALAEGQRRAFQMLIERLTLASGRGRIPQPGNAQLNELVQGFEVASERRSGVRYIAEYIFRFRPDSVRDLLRRSGVAFAETPSKPLVVLPVLQDGDRTALWEDPNPWRDAWGRIRLPPGLVPLVIPLTELDDIAAIDGAAAARGDDAALKLISQHHDNDDVLVSQAAFKNGAVRGLDVTTTRYAPGRAGAEQSWSNSVAANPGESDGDLMMRAVGETMARVEDAWKTANILDFRQSGTIAVLVPIGTLQDWVAVRDRLTGIPAVRNTRLMSLDRDGARLEISFVGDPQQLRLALAQRDLELSGNDPDLVLRQRAPSGAPR